MRRALDLLLPRYSRVWLMFVVIANFGIYIGTRILASQKPHYSLELPIDRQIPFLSFFVIFYLAAYLQWIFGYILIARESEQVCRVYARADIIAKLISGLFFLLLPTTLIRAQITGSGLFDRLTALIYRFDAPDNLFPSIHCLESWVCLRSAWSLKKAPRWYRPFSLVMTILVFASTVFLKQHVFVDIPGGVLVFEAGLVLSGLIENNRKK